ncbi:MAG: hypothetical protein KatS3mg034_1683 [Vicingaceae bacterium]|nr:MAG: hypothetical protein KatS3mg034_1683 [Vicingaceae bacterium]
MSKPRKVQKTERKNHGKQADGKVEQKSKKTGNQSKNKKYQKTEDFKSGSSLIRLNKFIANAGICSRREADELIKAGVIKVNGKVVTELGYKIKPGDKVHYGDQLIKSEKKVYILLNKPKDYLTTVDDPYSRKTVMQLIQGATKERVYPVGRLDRQTTGLLLLTNDGELTKRLTHPRYGVKKIYHVTTDKNVKSEDLEKMLKGIKLEEGVAKVDRVSYVGDSKKDIGVEIHIGWNRVIRRIFETLGYKVVKLDRVFFAGLTKKGLPRGKWRFLTEEEVGFLYQNAGMPQN